MKRIFVTGHRGYVGVQLVDLLKVNGYQVTGCDLNLFEGCACTSFTLPDRELLRDIRSLTPFDLEGHDCVMHLAAISNDPMGELDPHLTREINHKGSLILAQAAKAAGVPLFLFASSCSIYGKHGQLPLTEKDPTAPLSVYAASKIQAEQDLTELSSEQFKVGFLRSATAYGFSPMLRIDLVVNNLLACALTTGEIRVQSDGSPWRPLIHCKDIARAFLAWLESPPQEPALALNIGCNQENYQVLEIVKKVQWHLPNTQVLFTGETGADPRNYQVNFTLLQQKLPHFQCVYSLDQALSELLQDYREHKFSLADFRGDRFVRLRRLRGVSSIRKPLSL